jgi:hypothetical protein
LEKQAKALGVEPREKDIRAARKYFATKAMMMARCLDTGLTIKKTILKDVDVRKFNSGCLKLQTEFISWVEIGGNISQICWLQNQKAVSKEETPVYEFLRSKDKYGMEELPVHYDAVALRDCYLGENRLPETWAPKR